ncbi:unnamed protein product [Zymoseptoria tritici ST99CH_1A5]|uniref:Uncharacterized protein n=1 Tax=Zymoseptoria tritici ST99CH_1A5 TaxID=1276529 RepID=A0A1Y6LW36_ZYMTR|nr:unnamed protein product [Zymoseptoria tritici ST99CH_1A5]
MDTHFLFSLEPTFQYDGVPLTMAKGPGQDMNASITVRGTGDAIVQLQVAFQRDRLSFPDECHQTGAAAFDDALKYHMSKGTLPTEDEVAEIVSRQKEAGTTIVTEEDFHIDRQNTRHSFVNPQIRADGFDIDFASMMLRVFSKGHGKGRQFDGYRFANKLRARKPNGLEYQDKGIKKADRIARPPTAYSRRKAKAALKKEEAQDDDVEDSDEVDEGAEEEVDNNGDEDLMDLS